MDWGFSSATIPGLSPDQILSLKYSAGLTFYGIKYLAYSHLSCQWPENKISDVGNLGTLFDFLQKIKKKIFFKFCLIEKSSLGIPLQKMYVSTIFNRDNQQGPTVEHMELCSMLCASLDGSEGLGENGHVYMFGFIPPLFTQNY